MKRTPFPISLIGGVVVIVILLAFTAFFLTGHNKTYNTAKNNNITATTSAITIRSTSTTITTTTVKTTIRQVNDYVYCLGSVLHTPNPYKQYFQDLSYYTKLEANGTTAWTSTAAYPDNISSQSCFNSGMRIYCIGGSTNVYNVTTHSYGFINVKSGYYANMTNRGLSNWTLIANSTSNPGSSYTFSNPGISEQGCLTTNNYVYCFDRYDDKIYYGPLTTNGIQYWFTSTYPTTSGEESCTVSEGTIYCIGGTVIIYSGQSDYGGTFSIGIPGRKVYYASSASDGSLTWQSLSDYPVNTSSSICISANETSGSYIYCISPLYDNITHAYYDYIYYTNVVSGRLNWNWVESYPSNVYGGLVCSTTGDYIYCTGGDVYANNSYTSKTINTTYYARILDGGALSNWLPGMPSINATACFASKFTN